MKNPLTWRCLPLSLIVFILVAPLARAEVALNIETPKKLPRNAGLGDYSPVLRLEYSGVPKGRYLLKLWLLESSTDNYFCASTQLCEREFKLDNSASTNANGAVLLTEAFDVFDYSGFLWIARLYDGTGTQIAWARLDAESVAARPPVLQRVGSKSCLVGEELRFKANATALGGQSMKFAARSLPPGAELNADTGEFKWKPERVGKFPGVIIEVSTPANSLTDAEVIEIEVKANK